MIALSIAQNSLLGKLPEGLACAILALFPGCVPAFPSLPHDTLSGFWQTLEHLRAIHTTRPGQSRRAGPMAGEQRGAAGTHGNRDAPAHSGMARSDESQSLQKETY
jgi:hypothetical protein